MKSLLADDHGTTFTGTAWPKRITRNKKLEHLQAAEARERFMSAHCDPEDLNYFSRRAAMFEKRARLMEAGSA